MFRIIENKGFHLELGGKVLSVQFGEGNYCDNVDQIFFPGESGLGGAQCANAEAAIWEAGEGGKWVTADYFEKAEGDDVAGYVTSIEVARVIARLLAEAEQEAADAQP